MAEVEFQYNGITTKIQCEDNQKMIEIFNKFISKSGTNENEICCFYNGKPYTNLDNNLTFNEMANSLDKVRKKMNILVNDIIDENEKKSIIKTKNIICPKCYENAKIKINNYKITLFGCKNNHREFNILFNKFENTQLINLEDIKCDICKQNKSVTYKNELYKCNECNMNLCPLCKNKHNNNHNIYNYDKINYICMDHKESYNNYCKTCNKNICFLCEKEHHDHDIISFTKMMIEKKKLSDKLEKLKNSLNVFNNYINGIKFIINLKNENNEKLFEQKNNINKILEQIISTENNINKLKQNYELKNIEINKKQNQKQKIFKKLMKNAEKIGQLRDMEENMQKKISIRKHVSEISQQSIEEFKNIKKEADNINITITLELSAIIYIKLFKNKVLEKIDWKETKNYIIKPDFISTIKNATSENLGPKLIGILLNLIKNNIKNWNLEKIKESSNEIGMLAEFIESLIIYDKNQYNKLFLEKEKTENKIDLEIKEYNRIITKKSKIETYTEQLKLKYDESVIELNNIQKEIVQIKDNIQINEESLINLKNEKDISLEQINKLNIDDNIENIIEYFRFYTEFYVNLNKKYNDDKKVLIEKENNLTFDNDIEIGEINIIKILNIMQGNIENYYKISEHIINNYDENERNYEILYNINEIYNCNIIDNINNNSENLFNNIYNIYAEIIKKNEIKLKLNIEKEDINKNVFFLNNTDDEINIKGKQEENYNDFLKELNESNVELYINNNKNKYLKYFKPDKEGIYEIILRFYIEIKDCSFMFYNCSNLINIDLSSFDARNVNNLSKMFFKCSNLENIDFTSFDTKNVNNMSYMFAFCSNLKKIDLSTFDTKNVKNMSYMFYKCSNLADIDLSSFDTYNVKNMDGMFCECSCLINLDLSSFDTQNVNNMSGLFLKCSKLENINLTSLDTKNVINMSGFFYDCSNLTTIDLSLFDTNNVNNMSKFFYNCSSLTNINLSSFNTENVNNMNSMFSHCSNLINIVLSSFDTQNVNNMASIFYHCSKLTNIDVSSFNTKKVKDMSYMFSFCSKLNKIDLSSFDTKNVINMNGMFCECSNLVDIDLSSFDTKNVNNTMGMFFKCSNLISIDLSSFDNKNIDDASGMFGECQKLKEIKVKKNSYGKLGINEKKIKIIFV